jgi:hypothetical protein
VGAYHPPDPTPEPVQSRRRLDQTKVRLVVWPVRPRLTLNVILPGRAVALFSCYRIETGVFVHSCTDQEFHHFDVLFVGKPTPCVLLFEVLQPIRFGRCHYVLHTTPFCQ